MNPSRIIGIDFGTHKTLVARWDTQRKHPEMIRLRPASGDEMPTFVHVDDKGHLTFGEEAGLLGAQDAAGFKCAFKRDLGHIDDAFDYTAKQLTAAYLRWIKELVESESLHGPVDHAVITLPAGWHSASREDLLQAAREAGFASVDLLEEPVAAGIAFMRSRHELWPEGAMLVLDWGAGTLDLAVLTTKDGQPRVVADLVDGEEGLGGEDLDSHLLRLVDQRLLHLKLPGLRRRSQEEIEAVRRRVIEWKIKHSGKPDASWSIKDCLLGVPEDADLSWSSAHIATQLQEKLVLAADACGRLLEKARAKAISPTGILLIGGSSQFPAFRELLEKRFPDLTLLIWERRLTAVAEGAAWHAAARMGETDATATLEDDTTFTLAANNPLGMNFVRVPIMDGQKVINAVFFGEYPVRVKDYEAFVEETGRVWNYPDFEQTDDEPAVNLHWHDAKAFCEWLTQKAKARKIGVVYRLPTDHEWSCAAGLGSIERASESPASKSQAEATKNVFVWGNYWPPPKGVFSRADGDPGVSFGKAVETVVGSERHGEKFIPCGCLASAFAGFLMITYMSKCSRANELSAPAFKAYNDLWFFQKWFTDRPDDHGGAWYCFVAFIWLIMTTVSILFVFYVYSRAKQLVRLPWSKPGIAGLDNPEAHTSPVSSKRNNQLGIHDLSGNVWEWVEDSWPTSAEQRILRGGAWTEYEPERIRASFREHRHSEELADDIGFRCVMERVAS